MGWRNGLADEPSVFVTCIGDAHGVGDSFSINSGEASSAVPMSCVMVGVSYDVAVGAVWKYCYVIIWWSCYLVWNGPTGIEGDLWS